MFENREEQRRHVREKWEALMQDWQASRLSVTEWCRQKDIQYHQFYYWKKRFNTDSPEKVASGSFLEISDDSGLAGIEIVYRGVSIRPSKEFDFQTLLRCLQLLRSF